ncbi:hypothetical protein DIPPA_23064 [Diplonema papillatum]|nr:hypothetical protein DIPPA_23064 [Diplonema papillatum]
MKRASSMRSQKAATTRQPEDKRLMTRKSGYGGHVPMFVRADSGGRKIVKVPLKGGDIEPCPSNKLLYRKYNLPAEPTDGPGSAAERAHEPAYRDIHMWSMREQPATRQKHPFSKSDRPSALRRIVGYCGHRQGAAFIAGETFAQEEVLTYPAQAKCSAAATYEPDKSHAKGRDRMYAAPPVPDPQHGLKASSATLNAMLGNEFLQPRIPGVPSMLRTARRPNTSPLYESKPGVSLSIPRHLEHLARVQHDTPSASPLKKQPWPTYPVLRGPTRVKTGGHDVFLVN